MDGQKPLIQSKFKEKLLKLGVRLAHSETSAVTMYFGVEDPSHLQTQAAISSYYQGEVIVDKILNEEITK